jgi:hypothetical protein
VSAARPYLSKNGISVLQPLEEENGRIMLYTTVTHSSGQYRSSKVPVIPARNDAHGLASQITYLRRYCYSSFVGVVSQDEDDDGEEAVKTSREKFAKGTALNHSYDPRDESPVTISVDEWRILDAELKGREDIYNTVIQALKLENVGLGGMPKSKFKQSLLRIQQLKAREDSLKQTNSHIEDVEDGPAA